LVGLLSGQDFDEAVVERIELVRMGDVLVQADAEELREHENAVDAAVQTVADGHIDETVLAREGDRRLTAMPRQRKQPRSPSAAEDQTESVLHGSASTFVGGFGRATTLLMVTQPRGKESG